ncbi:ectoine/hydroxyectoine ABC transporter substrate-binding protein EhuB [Sinomonas humi]|uniref:Solute-binding protein family 3/N-terminal domain-containing protein n=1 Tax=Sinomonas humi TaxID=1338436 RepID=A0A0B2ARK0_9MICC|nr:ectoine/hydroxyectoine ABC transporter substrate-binding protein EhuB [Sinomonas humi]KHL04552.1 hypothetical protein LK10_04705 [Sinomonas humi]
MQNKNEWSRRTFLKGSSWFAAAGIAAPLLSSCAGPTANSATSSLDALKKQGFVNVGVFGSPIWGYTDKSGRVTGEAPEVARAVFNKLGVPDIKATQVSFDQLIPALNAGQFDVICAGMYITPARCKNAQFSTPDLIVLEAFLTPKGNPLNIKTLQDVASKNAKLAMLSGTPEKDWALSAGVKAEQITVFDGNQQMLEAVQTGRVNVGISTDLTMKQLLKQNPNAPLEVAAEFQPSLNGKPVTPASGFVFRQGNQQLVDAFNQQLTAIHDSGEWLKIVEPFGLTKDNLPPKDLTTQQLCTAS